MPAAAPAETPIAAPVLNVAPASVEALEARVDEGVAVAQAEAEPVWTGAGELELKKIPFFVRGKARRNTESFAAGKGLNEISIDTLYEAKAHYAR